MTSTTGSCSSKILFLAMELLQNIPTTYIITFFHPKFRSIHFRFISEDDT